MNKHGLSSLTGKVLKEYEHRKDEYIKMMEKLLVGSTGEDPSFLSCGSHTNHHFSGTGGDNKYGIPKVRLEIYCPKGTQGLYAAPFNHYNSKNRGSDGFWNGKDAPNSIHEAEVFLQRGSKFRVLEAMYDRSDDRWYIKVEVIGQEVRKTDGYERIRGKKSSGYKTKFK